MAYTNLSDLFKGICDAIRAKKGTTGTINHQDIPSEIAGIEPVLDGCKIKTFEVINDGTRDLYVSEADSGLYVSEVVSKTAQMPLKIEIIQKNSLPREGELSGISTTMYELFTDIMITYVSNTSSMSAYLTANYLNSYIFNGDTRSSIITNVTNGAVESSYSQPIGWSASNQKWKIDIGCEQSTVGTTFTVRFYYPIEA